MSQLSEITLESNIVQREGNIVSDMNGEKVMLNVQMGKYYNLGVIGGEIWSLLHAPITTKKIVNTLFDKYDIEKSKCESQVLDFLNHLYKEELIQKA